MLRIALADDHPVVRKGVRAFLESGAGLKVVAEASSPAELLADLEAVECEVVITDFAMPSADNADGLKLLATLQDRWPDKIVVVLTLIENPAVLRSILESGVPGLLNKADSLAELPLCLNALAAGRAPYVSTTIKALLELQQRGRLSGRNMPLSPRESEVLRYFTAGMSVTEIAERLGRSPKTISRQKRSAMEKLGLDSDKAIFEYAQERGLPETP